MINKYAEIQQRIRLYNACKGILRVKLAEDIVRINSDADPYNMHENKRLALDIQKHRDALLKENAEMRNDLDYNKQELAKAREYSAKQQADLAKQHAAIMKKYDDYDKLDAKNAEQEATIRKNNDMMAKMRDQATFGGAIGGGAIGGGIGYAGSNWLGKQLGLKGTSARLLNLAGTAAGAGLGGWGGYTLGNNVGNWS